MTSDRDALALYYHEDSGSPEPPSSDYVTLFLVHGTEFHCGIFRHLIPYAKSKNMRLVALDQRDFTRSSSYSSEEVEALESPDATVRTEAIRAIGREYAEFMAAFVQKHNTPPISTAADGSKKGGVAFLHWSQGNILLLSMLASVEKLPAYSRNLLSTHLRTAIYYDGATYIIGEDITKFAPTGGLDWTLGIWSPLHDPSQSLFDKAKQFAPFASSYLPPLSASPSTLPEDLPQTMNMLSQRVPLHRTSKHPLDYTPTSQRMTSAELASVVDPGYWSRSSTLLLRSAVAPVAKDHLLRTLQIPRDGDDLPIWPNLKILVVWCDMTFAEATLSPSFISNHYSELKKRGANVRPIEVVKMNGNHFAHWDDPEYFISVLASHI